MRTARWDLFAHSGELLGTYEGATPAEAIRAMYRHQLGLDGVFGMSETAEDSLVRLWGGRASCRGSIPAMAAVTEEPCPATEREGAS